MKRIKHNDLSWYFIREHKTLPASYLASCEKFFKRRLKIARESFKHQASSTKPQASSLTDPGSGTIKDLESRKL